MWSSSSCWSLLVTAFNEQLLPWSMVTHWRARKAQRAHPSVVKHVPSPCGSRLFTDDRVDRPAITRKNHSRKQSGTALISLLQFRCTLLHSAFGCSLQAEVPFGFRGLRASGNKLPRTEIFCSIWTTSNDHNVRLRRSQPSDLRKHRRLKRYLMHARSGGDSTSGLYLPSACPAPPFVAAPLTNLT